MNQRRQKTYSRPYARPEEVEVEVEDYTFEENRKEWRACLLRALTWISYFCYSIFRKIVRAGVGTTAYVTVRIVYVLIPVFVFGAIVAGISHAYIELEEQVMSEAQAAYVSTVDYLAEKHGYSVNFNSNIVAEVSQEEHTHANVVRLVRREMIVNEIPEGYEAIILAVLYHESARGNPYATSRAQAKGIGQVMDATARQMGFHPLEMYNLEKGIIASVRWFKAMLVSQKWDLVMALKEYNAGDKRIDMTEENRKYPGHVFNALKYAHDASAWTGLYQHAQK